LPSHKEVIITGSRRKLITSEPKPAFDIQEAVAGKEAVQCSLAYSTATVQAKVEEGIRDIAPSSFEISLPAKP